MTLHLQHFDTKLRKTLSIQEKIDNSLAEYFFPNTEFALGLAYEGATNVKDLTEHGDKTLQFASGKRLYFADQAVREQLYPNPSDGAAYGSLVFTPSRQFFEKKQVRILVIDDATGANGGLLPSDIARKLVGDCYGKVSQELAQELTSTQNTPFQFRIGIKPQAGNDVYRIAKGTLAPAHIEGLGVPTLQKNTGGQVQTKVGYDLILATSSFKGRKGADAIQPGEYSLTIGIGIKALAEYGEHSLGTQILVNYPRGVKADVLPELKEKADELAKVQADPRQIAQLYVQQYERRQSFSQSSLQALLEIEPDLEALETAIDEAFGDEEVSFPDKQDNLLYRLLKANLNGHPQLLEHPKVIAGLNNFVRKRWVDIATGRSIKFASGLAQPSWDLNKDQICVPHLPEGQEVIVTRSPLVNSNGVIVLTNKHLPEVKDQQGTIHIHPETAAEHLQADFDGDRLAFALTSKYPTLAAEVKEYNLPQNRYPDVIKRAKVAYEGSFEEIAISAMENKIGMIANQIQQAVALQWETQLIPEQGKIQYVNQIRAHFKKLVNKDADPKQDFQLPPQFAPQVKSLAELPKQTSNEQADQTLADVKKLLFTVVSELSNELQVAVDGPKSAARPDEALLKYSKAVTEYTSIDWLKDKKNPEIYLNRTMESSNHSPIDLMVRQTNEVYTQSQLIARPAVEFRPLFQGVVFLEDHQAKAGEITKTYNDLIKQAISLDKRSKTEPGPSLTATSTLSGKQIEITNLLKFEPKDSPVWDHSTLDIKLLANSETYLPNTLMAVVIQEQEGNLLTRPIGTVPEELVKEHNLQPNIRFKATVALTSGVTTEQVNAKFKEAAQYLSEVRQNTPEEEHLPIAAALWHLNHARSEKSPESNNLKKASVAFNAFPDQVINQLATLQFSNLTVVGVHQQSNEHLGRKWNGEKAQCEIALETDSANPNYGKKIVLVEGKKFAPLSGESPSLPAGTHYEAEIVTPPGAAVVATTSKGNTLKINQIKNHHYADRQWTGETAQLQFKVRTNHNRLTPVVLIADKVLGVLDEESAEKLKSNGLPKPGVTLTARLQNTTSTVAYLKVDPQSVVYPEYSNSITQNLQERSVDVEKIAHLLPSPSAELVELVETVEHMPSAEFYQKASELKPKDLEWLAVITGNTAPKQESERETLIEDAFTYKFEKLQSATKYLLSPASTRVLEQRLLEDQGWELQDSELDKQAAALNEGLLSKFGEETLFSLVVKVDAIRKRQQLTPLSSETIEAQDNNSNSELLNFQKQDAAYAKVAPPAPTTKAKISILQQGVATPERPLKPENWATVARAVGYSSEYTDAVRKLTATVEKDGKQLPEHIVTAMQQDFRQFQEINTRLNNWLQAASAIGKKSEYLKRITEVTNDFNAEQDPKPLSERAIAAMQQDLNQYAQLKSKSAKAANSVDVLQNGASLKTLGVPQATKILATEVLAKQILDAVGRDIYEDGNYRLTRQGNAVAIEAKDSKGETTRSTSHASSKTQLTTEDFLQIRQISKTISTNPAPTQNITRHNEELER